MKFDDNGKLIPKISPEEVKVAITKNRIAYNNDIRAKNTVHKIAEALAVITIQEGVEALKPIQSKISPKLQEEINEKITAISIGISGGWLRIDKSKIASSLKQIIEYYEVNQN